MNKKLFFALLPRGYWITIAILLVIVGGNYVALSYILINIILLLVALKVALVIHETGHLVAAKMVGGIPKKMIFGRGHEVYRTKIGKIRLIVNSNFAGGLAFATFPNRRLIRFKLLFFSSGGFVFNFLSAAFNVCWKLTRSGRGNARFAKARESANCTRA